jgi:hypothetical protein
MFEPTIPFGEPELMRASAYRLYLKELEGEAAQSGVSSRISSLSPSLRADLYRFEADGGTSEVLEVVAACVRHAKRVAIHLQSGEHVVPLTVFPEERLVHCPLAMDQLLAKPLTELRVMHVEPALLRPPGDEERGLIGEERLHFPLAPLLWELAMRGGRNELLPEIAGPAVYRITPGLQLGNVQPSSAMAASIYRLRREASPLSEIADWPGMDRERAVRLLNALYLQAGLMVSRSHPGAISDSWKRKGRGAA